MGAIFATLAVLVILMEGVALWSGEDELQPITYYWRKAMERPAVWVATLIFWVWLGYHFFIEGS